MANSHMISEIESKLPIVVKKDWVDTVMKQKLESKPSAEKFEHLMNHLSESKKKARYQLAETDMTVSRTGTKLCLVTGKTFHINSSLIGEKMSHDASTKSTITYDADKVLLKTHIIKDAKHGLEIGVLEDNASTSNYVTHYMAEKMNLKGIDIKLKIEGINSIKEIKTKTYWVPIRDKWGKLHLIQCYGLEKIATDAILPDHGSYKNLCRKFSVSVSQVQRPIKIDLLLSSRTNYLMSSRHVKTFNGMQMFDGPLGKTITGFDHSLLFPNNEGHCHVKSYLTRATPTTNGSSVVHENVASSSRSKAQQTDTISTSLLVRERENQNFKIDDLTKKLEIA